MVSVSLSLLAFMIAAIKPAVSPSATSNVQSPIGVGLLDGTVADGAIVFVGVRTSLVAVAVALGSGETSVTGVSVGTLVEVSVGICVGVSVEGMVMVSVSVGISVGVSVGKAVAVPATDIEVPCAKLGKAGRKITTIGSGHKVSDERILRLCSRMNQRVTSSI